MVKTEGQHERSLGVATGLGMVALLGIGFGVYSLFTGGDAHVEPNFGELDALAAQAATHTKSEAEREPVQAKDLTFPDVLTAMTPDLSDLVAAATEELSFLQQDRPTTVAFDDIPATEFVDGSVTEMTASAPSDPLLAQALNSESPALAADEETKAAGPHWENATLPEKDRAGSEGRFLLQVVSYQSRAQAEAFRKVLEARGHRVLVQKTDIPKRGIYYRVRIGHFKTKGAALRYRRRFERREELAPFVVELPKE